MNNESLAPTLLIAYKSREHAVQGFANQVTAAPPVNIVSQAISKASIEVLQSLPVQKEIFCDFWCSVSRLTAVGVERGL
jgi:hypothetical protein